MKVPKYLNTDFFGKVIENGFHLVNFKIGETKVEIGTSAGDNYCSTIYRVFLDVIDSQENVQKVQFLIKHELSSDNGGGLLEIMEVFGKEVDMLKNIMPRLSKIAGGVQFAARFYHSLSVPKSKMLVVQDLKELNFRMIDRKSGLDYDHCCIALEKLGQMHAASMVLAKDNPSLMDKYSFGIFRDSVNSTGGYIEQLLGQNFPSLCDAVKDWEDFGDISAKLEKIRDTFWTIACENISNAAVGYRVLNHGDFWINNFLFKYNEMTGKPIDTLFVDLQLSHYTSPANDLQYFLNTSPRNDIREKRREDLLRVYYKSFVNTLKDLNHRIIPTFDDLLAEMSKREMYGFMAAVYILPLVLMETQSSHGSGIDGLVDPDASKDMTRIMISGKRYTEAIKLILRRCDQIKLFDFE